MADVVVVEAGDEAPTEPVEAAVAEAAAEAAPEVAETSAEAAVEIAAIEAERDVQIAEIHAEQAAHSDDAFAAAAEANAEDKEGLEECRMRLSALEATTAEILARLIPPEPPPPESPPPADESDALTPDSQEAPVEPAKRRRPTRWI